MNKKILTQKTLTGYIIEPIVDGLEIIRAKKAVGDCVTGDNSAPMISFDCFIWINYKDALKELKLRDEFLIPKDYIKKVSVTLKIFE